MASGKTSRYLIPFPKTTDNDTLCADQESMMDAIDAVMNEVQDFLQAGVVSSTDWSFTAKIVSGTGELGSTAEVAESLAWLPDPTEAKKLMRSKTAKAAIAAKALSSGSLPASGKYAGVAFELTATSFNKEATVTTKAGAEKATSGEAALNLPATTAGKLQIRAVVVHNNAGTYEIVGNQKDLRFAAATLTSFSAPVAPRSVNEYHGLQAAVFGTEYEPSSTRPAFIVLIVETTNTNAQETIFRAYVQPRAEGGAYTVAETAVIGKTTGGRSVATTSFICPGGCKWYVESNLAGAGESASWNQILL